VRDHRRSRDNDRPGDGRIIDMGSPGWLDRYVAGKRAEVWHELRQLGAAVREPDVVDEAQAVCDQMAWRARQNIETIVTRLAEQGYRFHRNDDAQTPIVPHHPPSRGAAELAAWLQAHFGMVPLTLLSWVRLVGDVWLVGTASTVGRVSLGGPVGDRGRGHPVPRRVDEGLLR
jgi:hypothetical protein